MISPLHSRLLLAAAALLFSTGGAVIKSATLTGWQIASFRSGVAAVALLLFLPETRRGWSLRLIGPAAAYAATVILFSLSTRLTTAANAIFLQSTAPLYLLLLGPWLLREKASRSDIAVALAIVVGMTLLLIGAENPIATAPDPKSGNLLAVGSGLAWALTVIGLRWASRYESNAAIVTVVFGNILAFAASLAMALPVSDVGPLDVGVIMYLGVFQIGLAYVCFSRGIREVRAFEASIIILLEPVLNPIWTWFIHDERVGVWALVGGGIILLATLLNTRAQSRSA